MLLSVVQFILLVGNQDAVGRNLLVDVVNFGMEQTDFLINHIFSGDDILNIVFIFGILSFQILDLLLQLGFLILQSVDLLPDFTGRSGIGSGGNQTENQRNQHNGGHDACQELHHFLAIFHIASFVRCQPM